MSYLWFQKNNTTNNVDVMSKYIYISGNTCICLAELFWSLIHKMHYFKMYMIKWSHLLAGLGDTLKFCLTTCYIKLRVKIHYYIFTEIAETL